MHPLQPGVDIEVDGGLLAGITGGMGGGTGHLTGDGPAVGTMTGMGGGITIGMRGGTGHLTGDGTAAGTTAGMGDSTMIGTMTRSCSSPSSYKIRSLPSEALPPVPVELFSAQIIDDFYLGHIALPDRLDVPFLGSDHQALGSDRWSAPSL